MENPYEVTPSDHTDGTWWVKGPGLLTDYYFYRFENEALAKRIANLAQAAYEAGREDAQEEIRKPLLQALGIEIGPNKQLRLF